MTGKYYAVLRTSLKDDTVYLAGVLAWRVRSVLRFLTIYVLWSSIFTKNTSFSAYSRVDMLSYILLTILISTVVLSSRTVDVAADISRGDLSNLLLKPVSYFKFYLVRDFGNKGLNFVFSVVEFGLFFFFLRPPFFLQTKIPQLSAFVLALAVALFIYYFVNLSLGFLAFSTPENTWAPRFLFLTALDFLAGSLFPLEILPAPVFKFLMLTPFPYLIYFPLRVYLGKIDLGEFGRYFMISFLWLGLLYLLTVGLWRRGLRSYEAWGR